MSADALRRQFEKAGVLSDGFGRFRFVSATCGCGCEQVQAIPVEKAPVCIQCGARLEGEKR